MLAVVGLGLPFSARLTWMAVNAADLPPPCQEMVKSMSKWRQEPAASIREITLLLCGHFPFHRIAARPRSVVRGQLGRLPGSDCWCRVCYFQVIGENLLVSHRSKHQTAEPEWSRRLSCHSNLAAAVFALTTGRSMTARPNLSKAEQALRGTPLPENGTFSLQELQDASPIHSHAQAQYRDNRADMRLWQPALTPARATG